MSKVLRPKSAIAAFAIVVSALAVFGASSAGAASGSLAAVTNGVTVTYTGSTTNDNVQLTVWPSGHTCSLNDSSLQATYYLTSDASSPPAMQLAASPATLVFGSAAFTLNGFTATIAAGSYTFCLKTVVSGPGGTAIAGQLDTAIVDPNATTTTTSTSTTTTLPTTTTTTAAGGVATTSTTRTGGAAGDLVTPAFTG